MELFLALKDLNKGQVNQYNIAFNKMLAWMKKYPLKNNRWGPFFEDIPGWSDTQINAVTFARFMMEHRELFPQWKPEVRAILDWVYQKLGNDQWKQYGVRVVNEQTAYLTPGNSHTSRQAAAELLYAALSGDTTNKELGIRQLDWATYMVDNDGKNNYPRDEVWMTDGYGDYVRHYLRAMAAFPELAPNNPHILSSTSIVSQADYFPNFNKRLVADIKKDDLNRVYAYYRTYDNNSTEMIRLPNKPTRITVNKIELQEALSLASGEGWNWRSLDRGGVLTVQHINGNTVTVYK
jgi:hypothetical protein